MKSHSLTLCIACAFCWNLGLQAAAQEQLPNIVWINCDDLRYDTFGYAGHSIVKTPNIDRLAAEGVHFSNAFVTTAICGPSRQSFLTGLYHDGPVSTIDGKKTRRVEFLKRLNEAGYQTHEIGKMRGTGGVSPYKYAGAEKLHLTEFAPRATKAFLQQRDAASPFCLSIGYVCTHAPFIPAPWTKSLYTNVEFSIPTTRNDRHFANLPDSIRNSLNVSRYKKTFPPSNSDEAFQKFVRNYMRCVASIDRSVGEILNILDEQGLADDTVVVFTSDHGFFLGEHGLGGKWLMHEPSIRIPFIVRGPCVGEQVRGKSLPQIVLGLDLMPTILEWADLEPKVAHHGRSLNSLLETGMSKSWRNDFLYRFHFGKQIPSCEGVRTEKFKYIAYYDASDRDHKNAVFEQLYDLRSDPAESKSLVGDALYLKQINEMRARHRALRKKYYPTTPLPSVE